MDSSFYTTLSRQSGLMREMQIVANNIANAATSGYRQEGVVFSEYVKAADEGEAVSMTRASARSTSTAQGLLTQTAGVFDVAIEGEGYFQLETPDGTRLTRAGSFAPSSAGELVNPAGYRVLDEGGGAVFLPPNASEVSVASDGTISADGRPLGRIGIVKPLEPNGMIREDGVMFRADDGVEQVQNPRVLQGYVEDSNVNTIGQLTRMIEIQRAYEMGQSFLESEDERVRQAIKTLTR